MSTALIAYKKLPEWTKASLPAGFQKRHNTMAGTWGRLTILEGELKYYALNEAGDVQQSFVFSPDNPPPLVEPQAWHRVEPASDDLRCYLEFLCEPSRYYEKKYSLSAPHSEVREVVSHLKSSGTLTALDLGCGRGRNSLFLQGLGYDCTSFDKNPEAIAKLNRIIDQEAIGSKIRAAEQNLEEAAFAKDQAYDLVLSTVVFQFLNPAAIDGIVAAMQASTKPGGVNLIVGPISTEEVPCPIDLPFTFKEGQLKAYYKDGGQDWELLKYNEDMGEFHRKDEQGNNLKCRFATLAARKPS